MSLTEMNYRVNEMENNDLKIIASLLIHMAHRLDEFRDYMQVANAREDRMEGMAQAHLERGVRREAASEKVYAEMRVNVEKLKMADSMRQAAFEQWQRDMRELGQSGQLARSDG